MANKRNKSTWHIVVIFFLALAMGAGLTYVLLKYPIEKDIVSSVDQTSSQSDKPSVANQVNPIAGWKTFQSKKYQYELRYPSAWTFADRSEGSYVNFGKPTELPDRNQITVDLGCIFATGFEEEPPEIVGRDITYGSNSFHEDKYYLTEAGKKTLALDIWQLNFPEAYKAAQAKTNKEYHAQCDFAQFIVSPKLDATTTQLILSNFKFLPTQ